MFEVDENILDLKKAGIEPIAKDEIFVQVNNTINYWISNHGRLVNNLRKNFYLHKTGDVHWTIQGYYLAGTKCPRDTYPYDLVAEHFLEKVKYKNRIWFIDGDKSNNYYKNLIYVDDQEYYDLNIRKIKVDDLERKQEYVPYITARKNRALLIYNGILKRCYDEESKKMFPWYEKATMCDEWRNDPSLFIRWYESNYYEVDGESIQVDKDLLFPGNKIYSPDKCCLLPITLNSLLANCKKPYHRDDSILARRINKDLPLGVRYNKAKKKFYGQLTINGDVIKFDECNSPEEAFAIYKRHKEAYILVMADRYKNKIPKREYDALLKVQIEPY